MSTNQVITCVCVPENDRSAHASALFGNHFSIFLEPFIFDMAGRLSPQYKGGYWDFFAITNGAFFMAPRLDTMFSVSCENGFEGKLSPEAFGITVCLYAYSHLSFGQGEFAQNCAEQYHLLRDYMMGHREARAILRAID
jgi:hypothetical protein